MKFEATIAKNKDVLLENNRLLSNTYNDVTRDNMKNINNIVNNNQQQPINQTINVTDKTSATELLRDLESLSMKKLQYNWKK